ncbi:MAG: ankyrin repeat domain-containing protein [Candidatus Aminicenantes bacterium]|nr:ankyrin repeat domain-containing protein [Candidatus Aminicenantes bacterium]
MRTSAANFGELLLDAGADANARDRNAQSPLDLALKAGRTEMARFLKSRGGL